MHGPGQRQSSREDLRHPVLVAADKWHVWDGCAGARATWARPMSTATAACSAWCAKRRGGHAQGACGALGGSAAALAGLDEDEVEAWAEASGEKGQGAAGGKAAELAEALEKWSVRCEMGGTIETALRLSRKMLTVDAGLMDRNPWLLNVRNGVVDLRDGSLQAAPRRGSHHQAGGRGVPRPGSRVRGLGARRRADRR